MCTMGHLKKPSLQYLLQCYEISIQNYIQNLPVWSQGPVAWGTTSGTPPLPCKAWKMSINLILWPVTKNHIFFSYNVFRNPFYTFILHCRNCGRLNATYPVEGQNESIFLVFPGFNRGEGCITGVVPLVPGFYDCAGDTQMNPWTNFW